MDRAIEDLVTSSEDSDDGRRRLRKKKEKEPVSNQPTTHQVDNGGEDPERVPAGGEADAEAEVESGDDLDAILDDDDGDEDDSCDWECVSGPLPQAARYDAQKFARHIVKLANNLGRKYKKSRREIMLAAGLSVRPSRPDTHINIFRRWYAAHHPNDKKCKYSTTLSLEPALTLTIPVKVVDFGAEINQAWKELVGHTEDPKEKERLLKHVLDWWVDNRATMRKESQSTRKAIINTMRQAADQFSSLVRSPIFRTNSSN